MPGDFNMKILGVIVGFVCLFLPPPADAVGVAILLFTFTGSKK